MNMALSPTQLEALYILLSTRSDFRLQFEGKIGALHPESIAPVPVNQTPGDPNYITTRFFIALNNCFGLNLTYALNDADDKRVNHIYDPTGTDAGNPITGAPPQTTNITRNGDKIRNAFDDYYDPSDPCPDGDDGSQDAIWEFYNSPHVSRAGQARLRAQAAADREAGPLEASEKDREKA
jgi:hypothetical protein